MSYGKIDKKTMTCLLSNSMTMTYDTYLLVSYVTCITIIDTIIHHILHIHTNDAYYSMTMTYGHMTPTWAEGHTEGEVGVDVGSAEGRAKVKRHICCMLV
jgi:hypothetical protein